MADICVLTAEEVGQLKHYKILPNHSNHVHISHDEAVEGMRLENYEFVEGLNGGRNYLTTVKLYFLKRLPSGGRGAIPIVQRVVSNSLKHITPVRF